MTLAFVVYLGLLTALVACWTIAARTTALYPWRDQAIGMQAAWFSIVLFTLLIGFRYPLDGDFFGYLYYYQTTTLQDRWSDVVFEPGFLWLIQVLKFFDAPDRSIIVASSFMQILLLTLWMKDKKELAPFVAYFFVTIVLLDINNIVRQGVSLFAMMLALDRLSKQNITSFALYTLLAFLFHRSAIIILPIGIAVWHFRVPRVYLQFAVLIVAYAFVGLFYGQVIGLFERLSPYFGYEGYSNISRADLVFESAGASLNLGRYLWPVVDGAIIAYSRRLAWTYDRQGYRFYHAMFLVGALLQPVAIAWDFLPFARALFYFTSMRMVCLSFLVHYCLSVRRDGRNLVLGIGICGIFLVWLIVAVSRGAAGSAPYAFW